MPTATQPKSPNAITFLKQQVDKAKLDPELRHYIDALFKPYMRSYGVDQGKAQQVAVTLGATVNWLRSQSELFRMDPKAAGYLSLSKAVSMWGTNIHKFMQPKAQHADRGGGKQEFPSTPDGMDDSDPDDRTAD